MAHGWVGVQDSGLGCGQKAQSKLPCWAFLCQDTGSTAGLLQPSGFTLDLSEGPVGQR